MVSAPSGELSSTPTSALSSKPPAAVPSEPSKQSVSPSPKHLWCSQHSRREVSNYKHFGTIEIAAKLLRNVQFERLTEDWLSPPPPAPRASAWLAARSWRGHARSCAN